MGRVIVSDAAGRLLSPLGDAEFRAWAVILLGVREGQLREIATFASPELFTRFELPLILPHGAS